MPDIPGNSSTAATIGVGGSITNTLEFVGDHDWFRITLTAGQTVTISLTGITLEDPYLRVRSSSGALLAENDDIVLGTVRDSKLVFTASSSGTYFIDVGAWDESYSGSYQLSVQPYTPPPVGTVDDMAAQLTEGYWGGDSHHFNVGQGGSISVNLTALTAAGQTLAREALDLWSDVIGVQFVETTGFAQITFDDNQSGAFSDGSWQNGIIQSAQVNVSTQWLADYGTGFNTYSFQTYVHEIGHALGLGHAGNYNGSATYPFDAVYSNDGWPLSIMSYFDQTESTFYANQGFTNQFVVTPMLADVVAMQQLYGLSATTRLGDTTYGYGSTAGNSIFDAAQFSNVSYTVVDSGGTDTLNYSGYSGSQVINLNPDTYSNVLGRVGNVSIGRGTVIENATGGSGNDSLIGNAVANVLTGNAGNDTLNGGAGADTMVGGLGNDVYVVDQAGDVIVELSGQGDDTVVAKASYTLGVGVSIEIMTTVNGSVTTAINLTGNELAQSLYGNAGDNILTGMGGADYMVGGLGNDKYYVDTSDLISELAGEGDDWIFVATSYTLREGVAVETLVAVNQDSLAPVDFSGNEFGQSLYGSQGPNSLSGGGGNDFLVGLGGNDFLLGGAGADNMAGGQGNDIYYVDAADWVIEAPGEGDDLVVALESHALRAGESVETLSAAPGTAAINLTGNALGQSIYGNAGNNVLTTGGGTDYLVGGAGNDIFVLTNAPGIATVADYAAGEIIDIRQHLALANGTDPVAGGFLRITSAGQLQVDANGGGDSWTTLANVSGSGNATIRYLSGGNATDLSVARSASMAVMAAAAAGLVVKTSVDMVSDSGEDVPLAQQGTAMVGGKLDSDALAGDEGADTWPAPETLDALSAGAVAGSIGVAGNGTALEAIAVKADETAPAPLPEAIERVVESIPASPNGAAGVAMPSAEMLLTVDKAPAMHSMAEVARVVADALAGGEANQSIDAMLASLPSGSEASFGPIEVTSGPAYEATFTDTGTLHMVFAIEHVAIHPDAMPHGA